MISGPAASRYICWDLDGVVVHSPSLEEQGCHPEAIRLYALLQDGHPLWQACLTGLQESREALFQLAHEYDVPFRHCERLLELWQTSFHVDPAVLALIRKTRQAGFQVAVASNQDHARARRLRALPELASLVDLWGFSCTLQAAKPDEGFYLNLRGMLPAGARPAAFIDDRADNLLYPRALGWQVHHYTQAQALETFLDDLILSGEQNA